MTKTRLKVLRHFLAGNNNVSWLEFLTFFLSPPYKLRAKKYIKSIAKHDSKHNKVTFKNLDHPLFVPNTLSNQSLFQVINECINKKNWHFYEIPATMVTKEDIVVDCGSAEGLFALSVFDKCKHVYLVEPVASFINSLKLTFSNTANTTIIEKALSDSVYKTKMIDNGISSFLSNQKLVGVQNIEVSTLDEIFYNNNLPITYIKIDLEGYDLKALLGAKNLIQKFKPKIAVTTYHLPSHVDDIKKYLIRIVPQYKFIQKGIFSETGCPIMLHAWCDIEK